MAVTRADKAAELQQLEAAFQGSETAILVDYKGLNVPQVTELRRQLRSAKASYKVVKNTLAKRALKGTSFEALDKHFEGTTAVAYTATDPVALAKTLTTFVKATPTLTIKAAAAAFQTSPRTCGKWVSRFRASSESGLLDRSSAPRRVGKYRLGLRGRRLLLLRGDGQRGAR